LCCNEDKKRRRKEKTEPTTRAEGEEEEKGLPVNSHHERCPATLVESIEVNFTSLKEFRNLICANHKLKELERGRGFFSYIFHTCMSHVLEEGLLVVWQWLTLWLFVLDLLGGIIGFLLCLLQV
jgi:hypothetical protein